MARVGFFTPVSFGDQPKTCTQSLLEKVDGYFYLGGRKAHIINVDQQTKAKLVNEDQSLALTCLKVISYFTIILPVIFLIAKTILRCIHTYEIDAKSVRPQGELAHKLIDLSVIDTLELDLDEEATVDASMFNKTGAQFIPAKPFTLREAATEVITKINEAIQEKSLANPEASMQEKCSIVLSTQGPWMKKGSNLFFYDQFCGVPSKPFILGQEQASELWLTRIIQSLVNRNHIQLLEKNGQGYFIQA